MPGKTVQNLKEVLTAHLTNAFSVFTEKHEFRPGDIVTWKDGMKNRISQGPLVVIEMKDPCEFATNEESGSTYFREPPDMVAGYVDDDGDFLVFYDSRRMRPY